MEIYFDYRQVPATDSTVTLGNFDGFHKGHQEIVERTVETALKNETRSLAMTFHPHPRQLFSGDLSLLTPLESKIRLFKQTGIDVMLVQPFTKQFSALSPEDFIKTVLVDHLQTRHVIVGYDYCFGKSGSGNHRLFSAQGSKYGYATDVVSAIKYDDEIISSTAIRKYLAAGELEIVARYMGRPYFLEGKVEFGAGRGTRLGFPTANIYPKKFSALPAFGVYLVRISGATTAPHWGVANIGHRPTFSGDNTSLEAYLFNFDGNLYGKKLTVEFYKQIREERSFSDSRELIQQIAADIETAKALLKNDNMLK